MTDSADRHQEDAGQTPTPYDLEETLPADMDQLRVEGPSSDRAGGRQSSGASSEPEPPRVFGRYRIESVLGGGGMGTVYLAHDTQLDRDIALKIPKFQADEEEEVVQRFYREARAMAALRHQNLCTVHDVGEIDGIHYMTMAYIRGQPLSQLVHSGRLVPNRTAAAVIRKLALALHQAHRAGVVHRDLKPANIIIDQTSQPVVVDFGLARRQRSEHERQDGAPAIAGTPAYMSPEQIEGQLEAIGPPSDIYSLGVILYRLLAGRLPFQGPLKSVLNQILHDPPTPPSTLNDQVDPGLEAICLQALDKDPQRRHDSMEAMAKRLAEYLKATAAEATTSVAVPTTPEGRQHALTSAEIVILCPVCATRIDAAAESLGREVQCPQCHTPIALLSLGAAGAEHPPTAQGDGDYYQLAEPVERLSIPISEFGTSSRADSESTEDTATSSLESSKTRRANATESDTATRGPWQPLELAQRQAESFIRTVSDVDFSLRWIGATGLFYIGLPLAIYFGSDLRADGLDLVNATIFLVAPVLAVSGVFSARYCLAVFQSCADIDTGTALQLNLDFFACFPACLHVLVPLSLALLPGLVGNLVIGALAAPLWLRTLLLSVSLLSLFPFFFLSSIQSQSVFKPVSMQVWHRIPERPYAWRAVYVVSGILVIAVPLILGWRPPIRCC